MSNISVLVTVYNEEKRIEDFLRAISWCNDIILINKSSTDRTVEIAQKYTRKIITIPYTDDGDIGKYGLDYVLNNWIMILTVSDFVDIDLIKRLETLILNREFNYDAIVVPYKRYVLGFYKDYSPWYQEVSTSSVCKKCVVEFRDRVHEEIVINSNKIYHLKDINCGAINHLTHESIDTLIERHVRYSKEEYKKYKEDNKTLRKVFIEFIRANLKLLLKNRSYFHGRGGIALAMAYLTYPILKYLYIWEKYYNDATFIYQDIRRKIINDSEEYSDDI